ncbi:hypothetical protein BJ165DRAFT_1523341 [Panaeolus papilionaceus]|nr:hypothetical protein BJ165DRAFT_1523341 [Panaeolus papilionaceus]
MPELARRASGLPHNTTLLAILATSGALIILGILMILGSHFVHLIFKGRKSVTTSASSSDPDVANTNLSSNPRLPVPEGSFLSRIRHALFQWIHTRTRQPEPDALQLTSSILQSPRFTTPSPQLNTVSEGYITVESPVTEPRTLDSDSISAAAVLPPYTYRPSNSTSPMTIEVNQIDDNNRSEQGQRHSIQPLQVPQMDPVPYPYRIPEDVEGMDGDSIIPPSELSFEDSLLPPEYNSSWGSGSTT